MSDSAIDGGAGKLQSVTDRHELDEFLCDALLKESEFEVQHSSMVTTHTHTHTHTHNSMRSRKTGEQEQTEQCADAVGPDLIVLWFVRVCVRAS